MCDFIFPAEVDAVDGRDVDREQQHHVPAASHPTASVNQLAHQKRLRDLFFAKLAPF